jgi:hypothetical protein
MSSEIRRGGADLHHVHSLWKATPDHTIRYLKVSAAGMLKRHISTERIISG